MENGTTNGATAATHTPSQTYLSTRGDDYGLTFETVVLKGLAADGGLFLPEEVPLATDWQSWKDLPYTEIAVRVLGLYISPAEVPTADLRALVERSYSTFRAAEVAPLVRIEDDTHLLELFHGPSYSFKDCALQFLGNLFEYFLMRKNEGKVGADRHHLTVVGATSGDTGSAAICGLRGKKDVSVFILHPKGRVSPVQEAQMTTVLDANVHNLAVAGTFDDCQDIVKALFGDADANAALRLGAVNSINWSRILAQIVYYFHSYFALARADAGFKVGDKVRFVTPTGNFGNILAGYFAQKMGLPVDKLVVATNENDILDRFWKTGRYEKKPAQGAEADGGIAADGAKAHEEGCKETLSPAMDILVSSNFERLLWFLAKEFAATAGLNDEFNKKQAGQEVLAWFRSLKATGGFGPVHGEILANGRAVFESDRVSDAETLATIADVYRKTHYVLDPHSAVGFGAARRSAARAAGGTRHISLATAHPAKFSGAVEQALGGEEGFDFARSVLPGEFVGLAQRERRVVEVAPEWEAVREIVKRQVLEDLKVEA
ncbi:hypothetical protein RB594_003352 [Gaeumannomyces avenae]